MSDVAMEKRWRHQGSLCCVGLPAKLLWLITTTVWVREPSRTVSMRSKWWAEWHWKGYDGWGYMGEHCFNLGGLSKNPHCRSTFQWIQDLQAGEKIAFAHLWIHQLLLLSTASVSDGLYRFLDNENFWINERPEAIVNIELDWRRRRTASLPRIGELKKSLYLQG